MRKLKLGKHFKVIKRKIVNNKAEMKKFYDRCLKEGYEGIILKKLDSLYESGRKKTWIKVKPVETFDGVVVGIYKGKEGTKNEDVLGGFKVKMENGNITRVGGGFTDSQRLKFWNNREDLIGKTVEFKGQGNDEVTSTVRFGVFKRIRLDK